MQADFEPGLARVPRWMLLLTVAGLLAAPRFGGIRTAAGFAAGAGAAYLNYRLIERGVDRLGELAIKGAARGAGTGVRLLIQFALLVVGVAVILMTSGINVAAALCGFFVCPAAVILEMIYELLKYDHS